MGKTLRSSRWKRCAKTADIDQPFDQDAACAVTKIAFRTASRADPPGQPDDKTAPDRIGAVPSCDAPRSRVEDIAKLWNTTQRRTILHWHDHSVRHAATLEPAILEIGEPVAHHCLPRAIGHTFIDPTCARLGRYGSCEKGQNLPHRHNLSAHAESTMVAIW